MARENKSRYAVLGLLSLGPMSGYDIKKHIEKRIGIFWRESYGQIYPLLKQFESEGLAERVTEEGIGKPDRNVYRLTEKGHEELRRWLVEPVEYEVPRIEILLKLYFGAEVGLGDNIRHLEAFAERQRGFFEKYGGIEAEVREEDANKPNFLYWLLILRFGMKMTEARLSWAEESLATLRAFEEKFSGNGTPRDGGDSPAPAEMREAQESVIRGEYEGNS